MIILAIKCVILIIAENIDRYRNLLYELGLNQIGEEYHVKPYIARCFKFWAGIF